MNYCFIRCKHIREVVLVSSLTLFAALASGQANQSSPSGSVLQKRYEAAQHFQATNDLVHAAEQYRIFLADTLGEIAIGRAQAGEYEQAENNFDEALRLVPDFPMMQLAYAQAALHVGDYEHAVVLGQALLQKYPQDKKVQTEAHVVLGRASVKLGKNAEAKQQFEAAVYLDPSFANGYELAVAELNLGDIEAARKVFAEMLASFGDTASLHMDFGQAYGNSDFQSDAVAEFQKAIAKDPRLRGAHYSLAVAYLATAGESKLSDAEAELRQEIAISGNDAASYAALGHLLAAHGQGPSDTAHAEMFLKRATELDPMNPDAFLYLGQFYADQKKIVEAEEALRQCISHTQDVSRNGFQVQKAHYLLARILMQAGDKAGADQELAVSQSLMKQNLSRDQSQLSQYLGDKKQSGMAADFTQPMQVLDDRQTNDPKARAAVEAFELRIKPAIADSYNNLGAIAGSLHYYTAALIYFQRAAEWQPSLPGLDLNWGRAAFESQDYTHAIGPLSRYLLANPTEDSARRMLGVSQFMTKDYAAATVTLGQALNVNAEDPNVRFAYAVSLSHTGEPERAVPLLEALVKENQGPPEVRVALGEAYAIWGRQQLGKGDAKDAAINLEKAMKLNPGDASQLESLQKAKTQAAKN